MNKESELKNIIKQLCEESDLRTRQDEIINDLKEIYKGDFRHKYSEITNVILKSTNDQEQAFMTLTQNLRIFKEKIDGDSDKNIKKQLEKLYDHINLECIRLQDNTDKLNKIKDASTKLEEKYKILKESLAKQQTHYITILGIFASIVLAFVGGLTFSSSVLSNIDKATTSRLIIVICFIALFFGNILKALFDFISKIALSRDEQKCKSFYKSPIFWLNLFFTILFIFALFYDLFSY